MGISIVVGLGFGDEGKGLMTSYLVSKSLNPLVIRFNGGHQAGHTVVIDNKRHVFSNFGSGSLQNAPTYWSEFCTIHPPAILKEFESLNSIGIKPTLYIDPLCMITTPYDISHNKSIERANGHGSCGVGFGQTIKRTEDYYKLHAMDMLYPEIMKEKLKNITKNYYKLYQDNSSVIDHFVYQCNKLLEIAQIKIGKPSFYMFDDLIFEGAQGVMLDMDFGFFPHVTRSNTTSKNVYDILKKNKVSYKDINTYYISRLYQTRHGHGFMTNEGYELNLKNNENETNVESFQGKFRTGALDIDLLNYALSADDVFSHATHKNILFTCADQMPDLNKIPSNQNGQIKELNVRDVVNNLKMRFSSKFISSGPSFNHIREFF